MSAKKLFEKAGVIPTGMASWGDAVTYDGSAVYVISIADVHQVTFDDRFELERGYWKDGQEIIYIGRAKNLSRRLRQFFRHVYGKRSPHRGGQAILLLKCTKIIHWVAVQEYAELERRLIDEFENEIGQKPFGNRVRSARMSTK